MQLTAANAVASLGGLSSTGALAVTDTRPVSIVGAVSVAAGSTLTVSDDTPTFAGGSLSAPGGTVALLPTVTGDALTLGGSNAAVTANLLAVGAATGGPLTITGNLSFANVATLELLSAGAIAETGQGAVVVGTLTGRWRLRLPGRRQRGRERSARSPPPAASPWRMRATWSSRGRSATPFRSR